ncbi:class I SAM-dependent methyltransferase [Arenibacter sp. BSSL-BM3]|uniref:Class I SAM-dependent methyltransferase n=1 Tax=Arenibacter arenosicollis TaxID=2762274 RepID=A0ABR7QQ29_9FLAO|nr:class I SAM-dependent methyltransferase [Arenibacter arenosicollis]MBC8769286.1 class I SAM-dependent methyltransferase [Arenibacter arenosicollis]
MKKVIQAIFLLAVLLPLNQGVAQDKTQSSGYTFKNGDPNGIGKWYMGREIAHVMGYQGMQWLDRPDREEEENTTTLLKNMSIDLKDIIADIGAGSGYHVFKMAPMARHGLIYAVDIQDEMLVEIDRRKDEGGVKNVLVIKGCEKNINLPENSVDKVLLVDVYHEFNYPMEVIASIKKALRPDGKLFLIEYRGEDDTVPIKTLHKMTEAQAVKEMRAAGMKLERNIDNLPWQHCMIFVKN